MVQSDYVMAGAGQCSLRGSILDSMAPTSQTTWQLIGQLSTIGMSFVFAIILGFGGGFWLDGVLGTKPWLTFIGFFVGLAAGVLNVYRVMKLADSQRAKP